MAWADIDISGMTVKGKQYPVSLVSGANPYSGKILDYIRLDKIPFDNPSGTFNAQCFVGTSGGASAKIMWVESAYLIVENSSGTFSDNDQIVAKTQVLNFSTEDPWYYGMTVNGQTSGASGVVISTDGTSTMTVSLHSGSSDFQAETVDNGISAPNPDAREVAVTAESVVSATADVVDGLETGEDKVCSVSTATLETAKVVVSDLDANESLVDSRMGAFA